jgi:hypothetical protein
MAAVPVVTLPGYLQQQRYDTAAVSALLVRWTRAAAAAAAAIRPPRAQQQQAALA